MRRPGPSRRATRKAVPVSDLREIYVDSVRESLRQVDRSLVWGTAAGLSVALGIATNRLPAEFSFGFGKFDGSFAFLLALAAYVVLGFVATSTLVRVRAVVAKLDRDTSRALKSFPSVVTWDYPLLRVLAAILPAVFVAGALLVFRARQPADSVPPPQEWSGVVFGAVLLTLPYLFFTTGMYQSPFPDGDLPGANPARTPTENRTPP